MKTASVIPRRRVAVPLVFLLATVSAVIAPSPAWGIGHDPDCHPGHDCTGFQYAEFTVTEGVDYAEVTVFAAWCCPVGQGQIDYETFDGSAVAGQDYQHTAGTLTYAGGGWGAIYVPITNDTPFEGSEQFEVRLTNFRGTFVNRGYETTTVRIVDPAEEQAMANSGAASGSTQIDGSKAAAPKRSTRHSATRAAGSATLQPPPPSTATPRPAAPVAVEEDHRGTGAPRFEATLSDVGRRGEHRPWLSALAGLVSLLIVTVCVGLKEWLRARRT